MYKIVIFLDFDGVLHPQPSPISRLFEGMPLLAKVLRQYPNQLELVISSAWRETATLDELKVRFPEDIREMVVGVTPTFSNKSQNEIEPMLPTSLEVLDSKGKRQREIELWLSTNRPLGTPWIAIDDVTGGFAPECENLLVIRGREGIQASNVQTLHAMIRVRMDEL